MWTLVAPFPRVDHHMESQVLFSVATTKGFTADPTGQIQRGLQGRNARIRYCCHPSTPLLVVLWHVIHVTSLLALLIFMLHHHSKFIQWLCCDSSTMKNTYHHHIFIAEEIQHCTKSRPIFLSVHISTEPILSNLNPFPCPNRLQHYILEIANIYMLFAILIGLYCMSSVRLHSRLVRSSC